MLDYYAVLQVKPDSSDEDIKKSYKVLARRWHPDKNPNNQKEATRRFKEISEAYSVLCDPVKRREYDLQRSRPPPSSDRVGRARREPRFHQHENPEDGTERRRARYRSSRRQPASNSADFFHTSHHRHHFINPDDLFKDFFKNDPFMDLFGSGGGGLFGEPVKDRKPRYSASKYRPRSKSLFRDPLMEFGFGSDAIFKEFERMDSMFSTFMPFTATAGGGRTHARHRI